MLRPKRRAFKWYTCLLPSCRHILVSQNLSSDPRKSIVIEIMQPHKFQIADYHCDSSAGPGKCCFYSLLHLLLLLSGYSQNYKNTNSRYNSEHVCFIADIDLIYCVKWLSTLKQLRIINYFRAWLCADIWEIKYYGTLALSMKSKPYILVFRWI